jgi:hypothetical protein
MNTLKQLIKDMAMEQIQLKQARKTGSLPPPTVVQASNQTAAKIRRNATKITAALNLYATLRGKVPCHCWHDEYWYTKEYAELVRLYGDSPISSK